MKGALLEKEEKYYTYLKKIFIEMDNFQKNYNWLISDCEAYPEREADSIRIHQYGQYAWISGEELTNMINRDDFQWIWAVLSGFEKHITLEEVKKYDLPYADDYSGFWNENVSMQHPLATIELVALDSSSTLFISNDDLLVNKFRSAFPLSVDLEAYNKEISNKAGGAVYPSMNEFGKDWKE